DGIDGGEGEAYSLRNGIAVLGKNLFELSKIDTNFKRYVDELNSFEAVVDELSRDLNSYLADFDYSPQRLDWIEERLFRLSEIKRKYNLELSSVKEFIEKTKKEIENLEYLDDKIEEKEIELSKLERELIEKGLFLSRLRKEVIQKLERRVQKELLDLGFKSVVFRVSSDFIQGVDGLEIDGKRVRFRANGIDEIEFLISLNPGESEKPLRKIASGGEISRIMLALKAIIGQADNISTMIFDEIDVGIGGETSKVVGEKLYKISCNRQVICITHLAPIACFSDLHLFIDKYVEGNRTKIMIKKLDSQERIKEISRMLSGKTLSDISIMHARELIEKCSEIKKSLQGGTGVGN
ncbi:MAG: DNA repair protein RecN, partial [Actinobacteria bacterium]|nr:DNA repair protein RecN [Actinomycetota bacterium]